MQPASAFQDDFKSGLTAEGGTERRVKQNLSIRKKKREQRMRSRRMCKTNDGYENLLKQYRQKALLQTDDFDLFCHHLELLRNIVSRCSDESINNLFRPLFTNGEDAVVLERLISLCKTDDKSQQAVVEKVLEICINTTRCEGDNAQVICLFFMRNGFLDLAVGHLMRYARGESILTKSMMHDVWGVLVNLVYEDDNIIQLIWRSALFTEKTFWEFAEKALKDKDALLAQELLHLQQVGLRQTVYLPSITLWRKSVQMFLAFFMGIQEPYARTTDELRQVINASIAGLCNAFRFTHNGKVCHSMAMLLQGQDDTFPCFTRLYGIFLELSVWYKRYALTWLYYMVSIDVEDKKQPYIDAIGQSGFVQLASTQLLNRDPLVVSDAADLLRVMASHDEHMIQKMCDANAYKNAIKALPNVKYEHRAKIVWIMCDSIITLVDHLKFYSMQRAGEPAKKCIANMQRLTNTGRYGFDLIHVLADVLITEGSNAEPTLLAPVVRALDLAMVWNLDHVRDILLEDDRFQDVIDQLLCQKYPDTHAGDVLREHLLSVNGHLESAKDDGMDGAWQNEAYQQGQGNVFSF